MENINLTHYISLPDDFKPASIDTSCEGKLQVGKGDEVTITLPHIPVRVFFFVSIWSEIYAHYFRLNLTHILGNKNVSRLLWWATMQSKEKPKLSKLCSECIIEVFKRSLWLKKSVYLHWSWTRLCSFFMILRWPSRMFLFQAWIK